MVEILAAWTMVSVPLLCSSVRAENVVWFELMNTQVYSVHTSRIKRNASKIVQWKIVPVTHPAYPKIYMVEEKK